MEDDRDPGFGPVAFAPPPLVSLSPFSPAISPSPRRLSSHFIPPSQPVRAARQLAWVSLQGRVIGAEEASSARAIGGGLSPEEAVAWELFSPIHRILIVAIVGVAAANSKKNKQIWKLRKSVELRDRVLLSMQQKLDNLCEQVNYFKDLPETAANMSSTKDVEFTFNESSYDKISFFGCSCQLYDQHRPASNDLMGNSAVKASKGDEAFKHKMLFTNEAEPEERRMSDLSDWAPSVSSSIDIQLNTLAIEQDTYNLRKECEEKDATIKELSAFLHSSEVAGSKRIAELEDAIRRKNMIITKLRKDMVVLEQKVMQLTRLRRPSFPMSSLSVRQLPVMADNLIYDMDSTTSPSSSDSDSPRKQPQALVTKSHEILVQNNDTASRGDQKTRQAKSCNLLVKSTDRHQKSRPVSPLKEKSMNQNPDSVSFSRPVQSLSGGGDFNSRRRVPTRSKDGASQKRWA